MKKILMTALALSALAAPAMAQTWQGKTYADGIATYDINATVATFCKFGASNNGAAGLINTTDADRSISLAEGDRTFNVNLQDPNDNTVRSSAGSFVFQNAVCNTPYTVTARSTNGGLKHTTVTSAESAFLTTIPYGFNFVFGGTNLGTKQAAAGVEQALVDGNAAHAGFAEFRFLISAQDKLLLQGDYTDTVQVVLKPKA